MSVQGAFSDHQLKAHLARFPGVRERESIHRGEQDTCYFIVVGGVRTLVADWAPACLESPVSLYEPGHIVDIGKGWQQAKRDEHE